MINMNIKNVEILSSQAGVGLNINGFTLGVAKLTDVEFFDGTTFEEAISLGLVTNYKIGIPENPEAQGDINNYDITYVKDGLRDEVGKIARNYVLTVTNTDGETSVVGNASDIVKIFSLPSEDAEMLNRYLPALADSRNLTIIPYKDSDRDDECYMFVPDADIEVMGEITKGEKSSAISKALSIQSNAQFFSELSSDSFIKLFLIALVKAGQDRYNKINRDDVLEEAAKLLSNIRYFDDGNLKNPSVADINKFTDNLRTLIRI